MNNLDLVRDIKDQVDRLLEDQRLRRPLNRPQNIPAELHGILADILYVDKTKKDIRKLLEQISTSLAMIIASAEQSLEDTVNKGHFNNPHILVELKEYTEKIAPERVAVFDNLLSGKEVSVAEVQRAMEPLADELAKHLHKDGGEPADMVRLNNLLQELGRQL
jgi:predicted  nucleic acid-binding Zn-ribbon protein